MLTPNTMIPFLKVSKIMLYHGVLTVFIVFLVILFIKQIENDCCEATLGKIPFIFRNIFNKQSLPKTGALPCIQGTR